ncbi:MAG: HD domain-containing protein [Thermomicrobiales bacterium]|nr:HD domain-containing protein [Thermomicrobiales bacterium]
MTPNTEAAAGLLHLVWQIQRLKQAPRQGWLDRGVPPAEAESVADHSLGVALLAWFAALAAQADGAELDPWRVLTLALVHDLPEAEIGDWTPYTADDIAAQDDPVARANFLNQRQVRSAERSQAKRHAEQAAIDQLAATLPEAAGQVLAELWAELAAAETPEARFVKQIDRLETFLQAHAYLAQDSARPMASFDAEATAEITDPLLASVRDSALSDPGER